MPIDYFSKYFSDNNAANKNLIIVQMSDAASKCLTMFYLSNKKFAVSNNNNRYFSHCPLELGRKRPITEEESKKYWHHI